MAGRKAMKHGDEKKETGSAREVFEIEDTHTLVLSFLTLREVASVKTVSKLFHDDAKLAEVEINKQYINALRNLLEIQPTSRLYSVNDFRELLSNPTVISSLQ